MYFKYSSEYFGLFFVLGRRRALIFMLLLVVEKRSDYQDIPFNRHGKLRGKRGSRVGLNI